MGGRKKVLGRGQWSKKSAEIFHSWRYHTKAKLAYVTVFKNCQKCHNISINNRYLVLSKRLT